MKIIESTLEPLDGYLFSMDRNTEEGRYELKVGIPKKWAFNENNEIGVEIISDLETGKLLKIYSKKSNISIDDLFLFVKIIIGTNIKIAEKEAEFQLQLLKMRESFENQTKDFYKELDELKENSFKNVNDKSVTEIGIETKKEKRGRPPKDNSVIIENKQEE
jgi:hypothetical protein